MRKLILLSFLLLAGCASVKKDPELVRQEREQSIVSALAEGKAVILADSAHNDRLCSNGITIENQKTNKSSYVGDYRIVEPGKYWVTTVYCDQYIAKNGDRLAKLLDDRDLAMKLLAQKFQVKAGQLVHIGIINLVTIKKSGLFRDERVLSVGKIATKDVKAKIKREYPTLYKKVKYIRAKR